LGFYIIWNQWHAHLLGEKEQHISRSFVVLLKLRWGIYNSGLEH
jgi:hypothetical protein